VAINSSNTADQRMSEGLGRNRSTPTGAGLIAAATDRTSPRADPISRNPGAMCVTTTSIAGADLVEDEARDET
jgi:hypothetical protein